MTAPFSGLPAGLPAIIGPTEIAPVGVFIFISTNLPNSWVGRCFQAMWGLWWTVKNTSLNTTLNATGNGEACHVLPYRKQNVLLEPVFREVFQIAWYMHCIAGWACRSVIQRLPVCRIIFVNAVLVMIHRNHMGFAAGLQNYTLLLISTFLWNGSFQT